LRCTRPGAAGSVSFQWERHWRLLPASELYVMATPTLEAFSMKRVFGVMTVAGLSCISGCSERVAFPSLQGTTNIVFSCHQGNADFTIVAPDEIRRFVSLLPVGASSLHLRSACVHAFKGKFVKPSGTVEISFHNHCLDLYDASGNVSVGEWPMPKGFYMEFYTQARKRTKWLIPDYEAPKP
jgi:hypothetical protein